MRFASLALKEALQYIRRRKNLTFVLVSSFFLFSFFITLFSSIFYYLGSYWGGHLLGYEIIRKEKSSISFHAPPRKEALFSAQEILPLLERHRIVASPRLRFGAMVEPDIIDSEETSAFKFPLMIIGIDAEKESRILTELSLVWGKWPTLPGELVIFDSLYEQLQPISSSIGEKKEKELDLIIYTTTIDGYFNYDLVKVVGVVSPKKLQFFYGSNWVGFIDRFYAGTLIQAKETNTSEIIMENFPLIHRLIFVRSLPQGYELVRFWRMEDIPYTSCLFYWFIVVLLSLLIGSIVGATVFSNIRLLVATRIKEIAVYFAMGASSLWIVKLFLVEIFLYGSYCAFWGGILNGIVVFSLNQFGIYAINAPMELFLGTSTFYFHLSPLQYLLSFFLFIAVVVIAASPPLFQVIRKASIIPLLKQ